MNCCETIACEITICFAVFERELTINRTSFSTVTLIFDPYDENTERYDINTTVVGTGVG